MKITIEIDDKALRDAVEAQVGATLAAWTGKALEEKAAEVIDTKLSRFSLEEFVGRRMDAEVKKVVAEAIDRVIGTYPESRKATVTALVKDQIAGRVHEALSAAVGGRADG